uniref:NADH dehydrogenase subunit 5 n=1 Tax=Marcia japonica TaxID=368935 RepID=UPI002237FD1A|nr:NADH dehydrogenase subunit 5 [Marcia japonica]UYR95103.1 NADH dehydrogenase subunit 5 [Marcia japonica]
MKCVFYMKEYVMTFISKMTIVYYLVCVMLMLLMFKMGLLNGSVLVLEWEISEKMIMEMGLCMVIDWVSCLFLMSVFFISGCVSLFSGFYMAHECFLKRFSYILQAFVLSMAVLVMFPGYLGLMVGWDGLGVVSFLLVVYYMNSESLSAGMITAISNRVGDVFFILVICVFSSYLSYSPFSGFIFSTSVLGMLILLGSMTKSAQVPFSAWLPEAMAAPTPVSTLVHSSTLVTAGVYVLIRFSSFVGELEKSVLMVFSLITILLSGSSSMVEIDMKKVVALSTLSQVGMMMFCISMGCSSVAFFHLLVHAFFKALMFMCVGGVIFYSGGNQDARFLGGIWLKLPLTSSLLVFSNLSLMGVPFFSGFYSKEMIVSSYLMKNWSGVSVVLGFLCLSLTAFYSIRMMTLMIQESCSCPLSHYKMESAFYCASLVFMAGGAIFTSVMLQKLYSGFWSFNMMDGKIFYSMLMMTSLLVVNMILWMVMMCGENYKIFINNFLNYMWFLKPLSGNIMSSKFLVAVSKFNSKVEMGWIRGFIWQNGLKKMMLTMSNNIWLMNFSYIGLVLFYCLCFLILLFV